MSNVKVGTGQFSFRNVPHFISLRESSQTDMEAEIQALLDSLVNHDNVAPFIARRLIQHLVTSNPSPRYIETVASAFREGNMKVLARESTAILLPPLLRYCLIVRLVLQCWMRSLRLARCGSRFKAHARSSFLRVPIWRSGKERNCHSKRWVRSGWPHFESPSVFNFYPPDFQPVGILQNKGLYAPEMMLGTAPYLLGFLNGVNSLIKSA